MFFSKTHWTALQGLSPMWLKWGKSLPAVQYCTVQCCNALYICIKCTAVLHCIFAVSWWWPTWKALILSNVTRFWISRPDTLEGTTLWSLLAAHSLRGTGGIWKLNLQCIKSLMCETSSLFTNNTVRLVPLGTSL